jgi:hypothetical protein
MAVSDCFCDKLKYNSQSNGDNDIIISKMMEELVPIIEGRSIFQVELMCQRVISCIKSYQPVGIVVSDRTLPE